MKLLGSPAVSFGGVVTNMSAADMPSDTDDLHTDGGDTQAGDRLSSRSSVVFIEQTSEAIASAQVEHKLLLVYIAGVDEDSRKLDQITWNDSKVVEVLSQQCVALCLPHNSSDAAHFRAMYPYREIPTIAIISHTGLLLKQHGGYVGPSEFLVSVEQATAMLYLQNAVTTVATLAAGVGSSTPNTLPEDQSEVDRLPPSVAVSELEEACSSIPRDNSDISEQTHATSRLSGPPSDEMTLERSTAPQSSEALGLDSSAESGVLDGFETHEPPSHSNLLSAWKNYNPGSVLLQIRLTNGENIRKDFNIEDPLTVVRDFVDIHRTDGNTNYSLAISYPRKIFNNEDMEKSLLELNLQDRATLIVVPNRGKETRPKSAQPMVHASTSETNGAGIGIIWKVLSYVNPFAYFTGRSADMNESPSGSSSWQYEPDPAFSRSRQTSLSQSRDGQQNLLEPSSSGSNVAKGEIRNRRSNVPQDRSWGGNVHTLPHDDDDGTFKNRNAFWNGNSTQYGGDDSKKN